MTNRSDTFGRLLKGAINAIAAYEGKTAPVIEDELGSQIGVSGGSIQRYKAGYLPPEPRPVQILAEAGVRRGFLARLWLARFLQAARYPTPDALIASLADALGAPAPAGLSGLPVGTVALLVTDLVGSTRRWEEQPRAMERTLERHDALLREAIDAYGGQVFKTVGDAVYAVFTTVPAALDAALAAQRALRAEPWGPLGPLDVRVALHVGAPLLRDGDYFGPPMNRVVRLLAAGHGGQVLLSLSAQELARDALPTGVALRDLGDHRLKDLGRPERVFQAVAPDLPADFPPLQSLDLYRHNLPLQPTPLIGREAEIEHASALLRRDGARLLTLLGPGGIGKTRLGLQVAAEVLDDYPDGVTFVALASVREAGQVAVAVREALGLQGAPGADPVAQVKAGLAPRRTLLVLDNVEQVVAAAPLVADLLAAAPGLRVLATSRTPLRLQGEQEFAVPPLALADTHALPPLERLTQIEAVRLFIERAQAVRAEFQVSAENAPLIAEICARLDGLPLAIELAAARTKLFAPKALLARLDKRLQFLRGGACDLSARQQTLRDAIAWSYDLLDAAEQVLFARLGVFVGGCALAGAEAVVGDDGADPEALAGVIPSADVLEILARLVDRSLVKRVDDEGGEPRFVLLETIREFALERLAASGEEPAIRARHARWVQMLMAEADPKLRGPEQLVWYRRLDAEHPNIRAALTWCFAGGDAATGVAIVAVSWWYWERRDHARECAAWVSEAIASGAGHDRARAGVLLAASGGPSYDQAVAPRQAVALLEESLALYRRCEDTVGEALCLLHIARIEMESLDNGARASELAHEAAHRTRESQDWSLRQFVEAVVAQTHLLSGDRMAAQAHLDARLGYARKSGSRTAMSEALIGIGWFSLAPLEHRIAWMEEAATLAGEIGSQAQLQIALAALGDLHRLANHHDTAERRYAESAAVPRGQGEQPHTHVQLIGHGQVAFDTSQIGEAAASWRQAVKLAAVNQCALHQGVALLWLAQASAQQGEYVQAVRQFSAAQLLGARSITLLDLRDQGRYNDLRWLKLSRHNLGEFSVHRHSKRIDRDRDA